MSTYSHLTKIVRELSKLREITHECNQINRTRSSYLGMELEELSCLYDKIDNGLISYNLIMQDNSGECEIFKEELSKKNNKVCKFLEAQLLNVVANMIVKDPCHTIPNKFKESLWSSKIKDKKYYNEVFELTEIDNQCREELYSFLQEQGCSY